MLSCIYQPFDCSPFLWQKEKEYIYIYILSLLKGLLNRYTYEYQKKKERIGKIIATEPKDERGLGN